MPDESEAPKQETAGVRFLETNPAGTRQKQNQVKPNQKYMLIALIAVFGLTLAAALFKPASKAKGTAGAPGKAFVQAPMIAGKTEQLPPPAPEDTESAWQSSPFSVEKNGGDAPLSRPAQPVLSGILTNRSGKDYAVIDEKVVKKGDRVADNLVKEITAETVTLQKTNGEEVTLSLRSSSGQSK
ncbi:MAG: hypothetical protein A2Y02_02975 [Omnitrophica bacterium GWA2_52_12]|nr:MAG: hypothetical protein A2Y02_02975 [Omnitrophica bacterium GWA2_52_12]